MKNFVNRIPYEEFARVIPHPVVIQSVINKYPLIVEKVNGVAEKRKTLGALIPKLQHLKMKEYGYHAGLIKNENLMHTHVNPFVDKVPAPTKEMEAKYPETYRTHNWPQVDGFKEATKDIFNVVHDSALVFSKHLDAYVKQNLKPDASKYQSLYEITKKSQMATARSFYYRERRADEDSKKPSMNYHYDRMNIGACLKDFYFMKGKEIEQPESAGLFYNMKDRQRYNLRLKDDEIGLHIGMAYHIMSAGLMPANAHAVYLPNIDGLSRASQAFFFSPTPDTKIEPPVPFPNILESLPEDEGVVNPAIGLKNWRPGMKYTDWNEAIVKGFQNVFFKE